MRKLKLISLISLAIIISATYARLESPLKVVLEDALEKSPEEAFKTWHSLFKKHTLTAGTEEYYRKLGIFRKKFYEIKQWNSDPTNKWKKGLNQFSDLTEEEFRRLHLTDLEKFKKGEVAEDSTTTTSNNGFIFYDTIHDKKSISEFKAINHTQASGDVFDQGQCGSCYAFATLNAIETNYYIATGKRVVLSRQQIVDCNTLTSGCNGGWPPLVGIYAKQYGMMYESDYQYTAKQGKCQYDTAKASNVYLDGMFGHGFPQNTAELAAYDPSYLYEQLQKGAVAVAMDGEGFMDYQSGIWEAQGCFNLNHAVLAVGFGVASDGTPYWIIKNSWGPNWGEGGYLRVHAREYDSTGNCFLYYFTYGTFVLN